MDLLHYGDLNLLCPGSTDILRIHIYLLAGACPSQEAHTPCFCFLSPVPTLSHTSLGMVATNLSHSQLLLILFLYPQQVPTRWC